MKQDVYHLIRPRREEWTVTSSRANANDSHTFTCVGEIRTTLTHARVLSSELTSSVSIAFYFISPFSLKHFFVMDS